jgi:hypothetical protein
MRSHTPALLEQTGIAGESTTMMKTIIKIKPMVK